MSNINGNTTPHLPSDYDKQVQSTIPMYNYFHSQTIEIVKVYNQSPARWLDTGCGTGTLVLKCVYSFPKTQFIMADPSESMLKIAEPKFFNYADRVTLLPAVSSQNIGNVLTNKCDVITAIQAHHYLSADERKKATQACFNNLNDSGIFITFENVSPFTEAGIKIGKSLWGNYQLNCGKTQEQVESHLDRFGKEYYPITVMEHLELYRSCGFKVVEMFWYSYMQAGFYCIK